MIYSSTRSCCWCKKNKIGEEFAGENEPTSKVEAGLLGDDFSGDKQNLILLSTMKSWPDVTQRGAETRDKHLNVADVFNNFPYEYC